MRECSDTKASMNWLAWFPQKMTAPSVGMFSCPTTLISRKKIDTMILEVRERTCRATGRIGKSNLGPCYNLKKSVRASPEGPHLGLLLRNVEALLVFEVFVAHSELAHI